MHFEFILHSVAFSILLLCFIGSFNQARLIKKVPIADYSQSRERKSFEDDSYDATVEELDYEDFDKGLWKKQGRILLCTAGAKCKCSKNGNRSDLLCAGQELNTSYVKLPDRFVPTVVHMEHNSIKYLIKNKILPGLEAEVLSLDFSSNQISDIQPGAFDKFPKLQILMLTHNKLTSDVVSIDVFTKTLGKSLHQLYLDYNFITSIEAGDFDELKQLTKLVLDGNRGLNISKEVFTSSLSKLEVLSLDKCDIKQLDKDIFDNLISLRALSLAGNPLTTIPLALAKLHSLSYLVMSATHLKELKEGMLQGTVPGLERLYMRKMKYLTTIGSNAFKGLAHLKYLDFAYSPSLSVLNATIFGPDPPKNISELNLQHCNLSTLDEKIMAPIFWKSMDVIKLTGNPFVCDCRLKWILDMKDVMRSISKPDEPKCKYPSALEGYSLYDAKLAGLCDLHPTSAGKFVVFLVFMVLAASLVAVGLVYARRRYVARYGGDLPMPRFLGGSATIPQMGYRAGGNIFEDEEEEEEEARGAEHPTARPAQPEFV